VVPSNILDVKQGTTRMFDTRITDESDTSGQHDQHFSDDETAAAAISKTNEGSQSTPSSSSSTSVLENPLVLSILVTETAERVAYFGFRAILVLYFVDGLQYDDATAVSLFAATTSLAYLSPLVGAVVADSAWGRFWTIWRFGCLYLFGLVMLTGASYGAVYDQDRENDNLFLNRFVTFLGLLFVCTGTGGIKPCVSAFGADQVVLSDDTTTAALSAKQHSSTPNASTEREERVREYFNAFYFCINVGALASFFFIPMVRAKWGFGAAFLFPTICMFLALVVFRSQKNNFKHQSRDDQSDPTFLEIILLCFSIMKERLLRQTKIGRYLSSTSPRLQHSQYRRLSFSNEPSSQEEAECDDQLSQTKVYDDASQALHILPIMLFFPIFWMLYDQQGSVWTLQATRLNLHGFQPEQLQILNPLEIMIFIPLFDRIIYPYCKQRGVIDLQPIRRMEYGMFLASISFFASAYLEYCIQQHPEEQSISVLWQIPQITILTVAEILLSVTGLEFAYSQAPPNMQTLILALYLCTTTIGDALGALLYATVFATMGVVTSMVICAICLLVNLAFFTFFVGKWEPYKRASEGDSLPGDDCGGGMLELSNQRKAMEKSDVVQDM